MSVELYQQFLQQFNYVSEQVKLNTVYKNIKTMPTLSLIHAIPNRSKT